MKQNSFFKSVKLITLVLACAMLFSFANATKTYTGMPWAVDTISEWTKTDWATDGAYGDYALLGGAHNFPIVVPKNYDGSMGPGHVWSFIYKNDISYNPAVDGAVNSLGIDTQYRCGILAGWGRNTGYGSTIYQDGKFYYAPSTQHLTLVEWPLVTNIAYSGLQASDYVEILGYNSVNASSHPNFTASGAPMTFGVMMEDYSAGLTGDDINLNPERYPASLYDYSYPYIRDWQVRVNSGIITRDLSVTSTTLNGNAVSATTDLNSNGNGNSPMVRTYVENASVTVTAGDHAGWDFVRWTGYPDGQKTVTLTMSANKSLVAEYALSASVTTKEFIETDWADADLDTFADDWQAKNLTDNAPEVGYGKIISRVDLVDSDTPPVTNSIGQTKIWGTDGANTTFAAFYKTTFVHDPSVDGPIAKIEFSEETNGLNGVIDDPWEYWGLHAARFVVVQNDKVYAAYSPEYGDSSHLTHLNAWAPTMTPFLHSGFNPAGLYASNYLKLSTYFSRMDSPSVVPGWYDTTEHPDFSANGAPVYFGFYRGNSGNYSVSNNTDNFKVKVYYVPQNTTITGTVVDSNTGGVNCTANLVGRSYTWKVLSTGENGVGTVGTGGAISFVVTSTGASDICIKVDGALSVKATAVTLSGTVNVGSLSVTTPDLLNDDVWDDFDLNEINGGFGNIVTPGTGGDYNCDGVYDDFDLNQINGGFGSTGACYGL